jgi:hypothetical protein
MRRRDCAHCGRSFLPSPRLKDRQEYCSRKDCQRARKRRWHREKCARDKAYRENQARAAQAWRRRNPGYWKEYRKRNPDSTEKNRERQKSRNQRRRAADCVDVAKVANMDSIVSLQEPLSGIYRLVPVQRGMIANMDAIIVEIRSVPVSYDGSGPDCKQMTR